MNYEAGAIEKDVAALPGGEPDGGPRRSRRNLILGLLAVAAVLLAAWWAFSGSASTGAAEGQGKDKRAAQLPTVSVITPGLQSVARAISATGTLAARRELPVGVAGEGGLVTRVLVEPGTWVGKGQVLATVDRSVQVQSLAQLQAQVAVAQSDAQLAQGELDRAAALVGRGFISKADLQRRTAARDAALARVKVAQAAVGEQRARTGRLDIRAPEAGLILTRQVEPGQIVGQGTGVLFRMAEGGRMEMQARLAESDLVGLRPGSGATVTPVGSDRKFAGTIWQVSPVIDPQTRQGIARIALGYDPALRPGGFAAATIVAGQASAPLLPDSAVQSDERGSYVYIVGPDDKVVRRDVRIGQVSDTGVAIASGLQGTERVVLSAGGFLSPGQQVKPIAASSTGNGAG